MFPSLNPNTFYSEMSFTNIAAEKLQSRAERLSRNGHVRKERSVNVPVRFTFISTADYIEDPAQQAEYMYGLIKTKDRGDEY